MSSLFLVFQPAFLIAIFVAGAFLAYQRTDVMLAILAMSVPVQTALVIDAYGISITVTKIAVACLAAGWLPRAVRGRVPLDRVMWGYASVVIALGASVVVVDDGIRWASIIYQWTVAMGVYVIARAEIRSVEQILIIVGSMALAVLGVSTYAIVQVVMEDGPPSFVLNGLMRAYGTFGEPNPLAAYLELSVPLLLAVLAFLVSARRPFRLATPLVVLLSASTATGTISLLLTQSRGGWLGFGVAVLVIAGTTPMRWRIAALGAGGCACLVLLQTPMGSVWWTRMLDMFGSFQGWVQVTPENWANEERRAHWGAAMRMFAGNPLHGVGAGDFGREFRQYTPDWRFRLSQGHAHNGYLQLAAESGLPGLLSFITWCGLVLSALAGAIRPAAPHFDRALVAGSAAVFMAFMVHSMVDYLNVLSLGIQIALVLAIGMTHISAERIESDGRDPNVSTQLAAQRP